MFNKMQHCGVLNLLVIFYLAFFCEFSSGLLRRCFVCRSRGELGSCKDPFTFNATDVEFERGVDTIPCASGWCGKIVESENDLKEEYGVATQRMCLQRGPSDSEDRCAYTKWQFRRVLMCFCRGDLCNSSLRLNASFGTIAITIILSVYRLCK
ncbi:hypothetical protein PPYR_07315 [Photinus pyralis]|uniref:Uncharacterized protein n=1 Tax=Photinus pyralis TaxID=7054 RepID=A0A1Y1NPU0_PHOPY|nr:hypothetical protein PPYR_07315 [Photinus pyralis]